MIIKEDFIEDEVIIIMDHLVCGFTIILTEKASKIDHSQIKTVADRLHEKNCIQCYTGPQKIKISNIDFLEK